MQKSLFIDEKNGVEMKSLPLYVVTSLILSLMLHAALLMMLGKVEFKTVSLAIPPRMRPLDVRISTKVMSLEELVKTERERQNDVQQEVLTEAGEGAKADLTDEATRIMRDVFKNEDLIKPPPAPSLRFEGVKIEKASLQPKLPDMQPAKVLATAPRPKIVEIKMNELPIERQMIPRATVPQMERVDVPIPSVPSLLPNGPSTADTSVSYSTGLNLGARPVFNVPKGLGDDLKGGIQTGVEGGSLIPLPGSEVAVLPLQKGVEKMTVAPPKNLPEIVALDEFVNVGVQVFRDRQGKGYFKVLIKANEKSDCMGDIPKDTLIIIDHSNSISPTKLSQFKEGAKEALNYLNPRDRFNIVSFNNNARKLFTELAPANDMNRATAAKFIDHLMRGGTTDVFGGIGPFVKNGNGNLDRPMNIFVLTDGVSTVDVHQMGNMTVHNHETDEFQRAMVGVNPGNVSIYPFSVGAGANHALLDFLGYLNRGHNYHVDNLRDFRSILVRYIGDYSNLIVRDMRYLAAGKVSDSIYPRRLPHLYRNDILTIFGRFEPTDKELVLTLSGVDALNQRRDLVFRKYFDECDEGTAEIAQLWAAQKVYHLRSEIIQSTDPVLKQQKNRECQQLADEFGFSLRLNK